MSDFAALYEKYGPDIFRFALYLTSDPSKAEDITAETFFPAWTTGSELRMATVKGYLITIARNVYMQQLRHEPALLMRAVEGLPYEEIAASIGRGLVEDFFRSDPLSPSCPTAESCTGRGAKCRRPPWPPS